MKRWEDPWMLEIARVESYDAKAGQHNERAYLASVKSIFASVPRAMI
jgi:hypothetical protein